MAKKTTRRARSQPTRQPIQRSAPSTTEALLPAETNRERPAASQPTPKKQVDFATEYHYVLGDLRKMAILAAVMFAVLISLSFVIR